MGSRLPGLMAANRGSTAVYGERVWASSFMATVAAVEHSRYLPPFLLSPIP